MPVIEESVTIDRPLADVFRYLSDGNNASVYDGSVVLSSQIGEGETAVGTQWRGATKILGRDFGWVSECIQFTQDRSMTIRAIQGRLQFEIQMVFFPEGAGTRLDYRLSVASGLGGLFGRVAEPLVIRVQTRTTTASLVTLKDLLESHSE
jgi:uncharacterized membrane protein